MALLRHHPGEAWPGWWRTQRAREILSRVPGPLQAPRSEGWQRLPAQFCLGRWGPSLPGASKRGWALSEQMRPVRAPGSKGGGGAGEPQGVQVGELLSKGRKEGRWAECQGPALGGLRVWGLCRAPERPCPSVGAQAGPGSPAVPAAAGGVISRGGVQVGAPEPLNGRVEPIKVGLLFG